MSNRIQIKSKHISKLCNTNFLISNISILVYEPFTFVTPDCTPGIHGQCVVFLTLSLCLKSSPLVLLQNSSTYKIPLFLKPICPLSYPKEKDPPDTKLI